ncbi:MAG TPA: Ig-like domain-containing protein [Leptospiraceae bacterium]|nr:Ig-like domain-containing protein [Leptospiraceae bacterium]HNM01363.1 Ig-like domain-containing protein [Leptospiraceae bacterium]HNN02516.1 Ig-like domain-containing protein [Leptospiraceae bacterium]HNO21897.1 Ig-like domain-containing protein [Leptospiraceae bacterium]
MKKSMKISTIGKFFSFPILLFLVNCESQTSKGISQLVPLILQGSGPGAYSEPGKNTQNGASSESVSLLTAASSTSTCNDSAVEPPSSFGSQGPEAFLSACSTDNMNRYRNLEIKFSDPMGQASVQGNFSIICNGSTLPGPGAGGTFIWKSPQRLIFDPYRELSSNASCTITISNGAQTTEGKSLISYTKSFKAAHDYLITSSIQQGAVNIVMGGQNDVTFNKSANLILNASFTNPTGAFDEIKKIVFNKMGNTDAQGNPLAGAKTICEDSCSSLGTPINLSTDSFMTGGMALTDGGNTYYFEITTKQLSKIQRYISFNYGNLNTNPTGLINNVASGVLDQTQMMKLLERLIEVFAEQKFRVTNKTFNQFAQTPVSSARNTTKCIDYKNGNFNYISTYGDNPSGGYCGPDGNTGTFIGTYNGILSFWSDSYFDMDVYVTNVSIPGSAGGSPTVDAVMQVNNTNELGVTLGAKKAYVDLAVIARNRSTLGVVIPSGSRFYFTTSIELNSTSNYTLRNAIAKAGLSVNGSGNLALNLFTLQTPTNANDPNFQISQWVDNLIVGGMTLQDSTSWAADLLSPITEMIANGLVPQVKAAITQSMLADILQKVAPEVLNAIVGTLSNPGIDISLPSYLPAPLNSFGLNAKVQLSSDAVMRVSGANKGIVASVHAALNAKNPLAAGSQRQHANGTLCSNGCFVYNKDPGTPLIDVNNHAPFNQSATVPGFQLALHSDSITQAAYHMWKNRAIDLNVDSAFIASINSYAGSDPLLKLTDSLLKASAIMSIIAPGQNTLSGIDGSNNLMPAICADDQVRFKIDPLMPPVVKMINNAGYDPNTNAQANVNATFSDLQVTLQGKRTDNSAACMALRGAADNSYFTMATLKVSMNANANFRFVEFDNPTTGPNDYLNSLSLRIFTDTLKYSIDVVEGSTANPYALDPIGIKSVFDPLVKSLVVPLVNSILNRVPLPPQVNFAALNYPATSTVCKINVQTDNYLKLNSLSVPAVDASANPYVLAQATLMGLSLGDPKYLLESSCR